MRLSDIVSELKNTSLYNILLEIEKKKISCSKFENLKVVDVEGFKTYCPHCGTEKTILKEILRCDEKTGDPIAGLVIIRCPKSNAGCYFKQYIFKFKC